MNDDGPVAAELEDSSEAVSPLDLATFSLRQEYLPTRARSLTVVRADPSMRSGDGPQRSAQ